MEIKIDGTEKTGKGFSNGAADFKTAWWGLRIDDSHQRKHLWAGQSTIIDTYFCQWNVAPPKGYVVTQCRYVDRIRLTWMVKDSSRSGTRQNQVIGIFFRKVRSGNDRSWRTQRTLVHWKHNVVTNLDHRCIVPGIRLDPYGDAVIILIENRGNDWTPGRLGKSGESIDNGRAAHEIVIPAWEI